MYLRSRILALGLGVILTGVSTAAAQDTANPTDTRPVTLGVKGGLNVANLKGPTVGHAGDLLGLSLGAFVTRDLTKNIGIQVEGLFSQRGAKFEVGSSTGTLRVNYLDIPVFVRAGTTSKFDTFVYVFGGATASLKLGASLKEGGADAPRFSNDNLESSDLGLTVGLGVEGHRILMDARYTMGRGNIEKSGEDIKNRTFTVMAGIRLW